MRRRLFTIVLVLAGMLSVQASPAAAQLCAPTANPCVVTASINVPSGSVFDLAGRDLIIAANRVLTVQGAGIMFLQAGNITLDDGARIVANGDAGIGGDLSIVSSGAVVLDPSSRIDVSGGAGGSVLLMASSVTMNGQIRANATLRDSEGGLVSIQTTGNVSIAGTGILGASGNRFGCGGFMEIVSDGSVTASAPIDFRGGDCDGGDIDIDALGGITIGPAAELSVIATFEFGSGGAVSLTAGGNITVSGPINGNGEGSFTEGGGDGADLDIIGADVTMGSLVTLNGGAPDGGGGFVDITAVGELRVNAPIQATSGLQGIGGDLLLAADELILINVPVMLTAGFAGGSFDATSLGTVTLNAAATVDVSSTGGPFGQYGGTIEILACNINIPLGADLLATGNGPTPRATIRLAASGTSTIGGTINAGSMTQIRYRTIPPVFQPGFTISPAPAIVADGALPCCVACGATTTTTSSSTSTSTSNTSTTIGGPTTSVVVTTSSTSTSSTTIPVPCGVPMTGCRSPVQPFKAKLVVKDKATDSGDKIVWKWLRGQATTAGDFGNPVAADGYQLCMWNVSGPPALIARVDAPAGGVCEGKPCWRSTGQASPTGFKYVDGDLTPNGTQKVLLGAGIAGKAKAVVKAKGVPLTLPPLPLALPVLVQLQGGPGRCFETYFATAGVGRNTIEAFEGRASTPNTTTTTSSSTTSTTSPVPICGNGAREFPEQCDDGNLTSGDCCSSTCLGEPVGQPCAEDGNVCTADVCSGLGLCVHVSGNGGVTCRPAAGQCDAAEQCSGVTTSCPADAPLPNGTSCDVSACETGETCTAGVCGGGAPLECPACESCDVSSGCVPTPAPVCRQTIAPEKSQLLIKDRLPDETDKIVWKWSKGEETAPADFGTPNLDDDYALCFYDETTLTTTLATSLSAPAGGACGGGACWRSTSSGYKYVDPDLTPQGIRRMVLKAGGNGSSTIAFKAKGVDIPMPVLPLGSVLRVQLRGNGECWQATYSPGGIKQNDVAGFQARSD